MIITVFLVAVIYQLALVEREINEVIRGLHTQRGVTPKRKLRKDKDGKDAKLPAKKLEEDDVCPICQEDLLNSKEILTHCKYVYISIRNRMCLSFISQT